MNRVGGRSGSFGWRRSALEHKSSDMVEPLFAVSLSTV